MSGSLGKNKVFINADGVIEICVRGDQTVASVRTMGDEALRLGREQRNAQRPALILDNLLEMGSVPAAARQLVVDLVKSSDYDKLAMLGSGTLLRLGTSFMLHATRRTTHVRYFDDREQAMQWLLAA